MLNEAKVQELIKAKQVKKQQGASMIEYAILIAGVVAIGALVFDTANSTSVAGKIQTKITNAVGS